MKFSDTIAGALLMGTLMIALPGCDNQGPFEEAGEEMEEAGDAIDDANDGR